MVLHSPHHTGTPVIIPRERWNRLRGRGVLHTDATAVSLILKIGDVITAGEMKAPRTPSRDSPREGVPAPTEGV